MQFCLKQTCYCSNNLVSLTIYNRQYHRLVIVVWLFLGMTWVCLQFMIMVFADHTHLLFFILCVMVYPTFVPFRLIQYCSDGTLRVNPNALQNYTVLLSLVQIILSSNIVSSLFFERFVLSK